MTTATTPQAISVPCPLGCGRTIAAQGSEIHYCVIREKGQPTSREYVGTYDGEALVFKANYADADTMLRVYAEEIEGVAPVVYAEVAEPAPEATFVAPVEYVLTAEDLLSQRRAAETTALVELFNRQVPTAYAASALYRRLGQVLRAASDAGDGPRVERLWRLMNRVGRRMDRRQTRAHYMRYEATMVDWLVANHPESWIAQQLGAAPAVVYARVAEEPEPAYVELARPALRPPTIAPAPTPATLVVTAGWDRNDHADDFATVAAQILLPLAHLQPYVNSRGDYAGISKYTTVPVPADDRDVVCQLINALNDVAAQLPVRPTSITAHMHIGAEHYMVGHNGPPLVAPPSIVHARPAEVVEPVYVSLPAVPSQPQNIVLSQEPAPLIDFSGSRQAPQLLSGRDVARLWWRDHRAAVAHLATLSEPLVRAQAAAYIAYIQTFSRSDVTVDDVLRVWHEHIGRAQVQ